MEKKKKKQIDEELSKLIEKVVIKYSTYKGDKSQNY